MTKSAKEGARPVGTTLGIDLGGTKILAGAIGEDGRIAGRGKVKTPFDGDTAALTAALLAAADAALAEAKKTRADVTAVGLAAPGPIDTEKGMLLRANNLAVKEFSIQGAFGSAFPGAHLALENDVRLAALGEARMGAGRGVRCLVGVWVGTGLGGAVLFDGQIWTGRNRNAGEIGQTQLDFRRARPGRIDGTFEGLAAKVGMTLYLREKIAEGRKTALEKVVLKKDGRLRGSDLQAALESGDKLTQKAVRRSAKAVGMSIANIFNILSPDLFVIGGGVGVDLGEAYLADVKRWADAFAFSQELGTLQIVPAALGDDAGLLGAALLASGGPQR